MTRRLVTLVAVASMLLCVTTVTLWVVSDETAFIIGYVAEPGGDPKFYGIVSSRGDVGIFWREPAAIGSTRFLFAKGPAREWRAPDSPAAWTVFLRDRSVQGSFVLWVRHWLAVAAFAAAPTLWLYVRCSKRHVIGLCPTCGYDLRATPARCPECGAVPAAPAAR